jgi:hypothetical protein
VQNTDSQKTQHIINSNRKKENELQSIYIYMYDIYKALLKVKPCLFIYLSQIIINEGIIMDMTSELN